MSSIKSFIKDHLWLTRMLAVVYNAGSAWKPPIANIKKLKDRILDQKKEVFFLQIGANDGVSGLDFIRQQAVAKNWKGVLVEPVPHNFKKLVKNYEHINGLIFENVAIGTMDGLQPFYHFGEHLSSWHNELGSFKRDVLYKHGIENVEELIVTTEVPVLTISSLLHKHGISTINFLNIDTEGYDYEILKSINFEETRPEIIIYEHRHLSKEEYKQSIKLLKKNNYRLFAEFDSDTMAVLRS